MNAKRVLCFVPLVLIAECATELFQNPGFEDPGPVQATWSNRGSVLDLVSDSHTGQYAIKSSSRTAYWMGPGQTSPLKPDTSYVVSCYAKQLNNNNETMFQTLSIAGALRFVDGKTDYFNYASRSFLDSNVGWFFMQGSFHTPSMAFSSADVYVQGPQPGIDFLLDDMSLTEVEDYPNWKEEANARIEEYRKTDVELRIELAPSLNADDIQLEIRHRSHSFGFGTEVSDGDVLDQAYKSYQNLLYNMFNYYTVATYKWKFSQGTPNHPDYHEAVAATDFLRSKGLPVRAHNMFWAVKGSVPSWVYSLSKEELMATVDRRLEYMTNLTRGKVQQWDVNNELLHGAYFEERTGDRDYTKKMFSKIHKLDPDVELFLNDYDVLARGGMTEAYVQMANDFKQANVGLYGLGLQGHFRSHVRPDPALLKLRLDKFSTLGLPLWITELDVYLDNETARADWYETAWRMFFSYPAVEGIIMWGFWDILQNGLPGSSLVNGNNYYINEAGQRWLDLTKKEWSTNILYNVSSGTTMSFRGFQGNYDIIVRKNGQPIKEQQFTLGKANLTVSVTVGANEVPISIQPIPTIPPFVTGVYTHRHFEISEQKIGSLSSASSDFLQCVTRLSSLSEVGDDKKTMVTCEEGQVMTSCSMLTNDNRNFRDGDYIERVAGKITCVGVNAFRSVAPVQAIARCCRLTGMSCDYAKSGPTPTPVVDGDQAVTNCNADAYATGCNSYTYFGAMDGAYHRQSSCVAQMDGTTKQKGGVFSHAACCSAPKLKCRQVMSDESGPLVGDTASVLCQAEEALVGCSVYSEDGRTAGAYIFNDPSPSCVAVNGGRRYGGEKGVVASAVCCRSELDGVIIG